MKKLIIKPLLGVLLFSAYTLTQAHVLTQKPNIKININENNEVELDFGCFQPKGTPTTTREHSGLGQLAGSATIHRAWIAKTKKTKGKHTWYEYHPTQTTITYDDFPALSVQYSAEQPGWAQRKPYRKLGAGHRISHETIELAYYKDLKKENTSPCHNLTPDKPFYPPQPSTTEPQAGHDQQKSTVSSATVSLVNQVQGNQNASKRSSTNIPTMCNHYGEVRVNRQNGLVIIHFDFILKPDGNYYYCNAHNI